MPDPAPVLESPHTAEPIEAVDVPMEAGTDPPPAPMPWVLTGVVRDDDGLPVPGAVVFGHGLDSVETGDGGRFELRLEGSPTRGSRVEVCSPGHVRGDFELDGVLVGELRWHGRLDGIQVVLLRGASIQGIARNAAGSPVAGARVTAMVEEAEDDLRPYKATVETDEEGEFMVTGLDPEAVRWLLVSVDGRAANRFPLAGRLRNGETLRMDPVLPPPTPVTVVVSIEGWYPNVGVHFDGECIDLDSPETRIETEAGHHWVGLHGLQCRDLWLGVEEAEVHVLLEVPPGGIRRRGRWSCPMEVPPDSRPPEDPPPPDGAEASGE